MVLGFHTNFAVSFSSLTLATWIAGSVNPSLVVKSTVKDRLYPVQRILTGWTLELGYFHFQATKPDTIGVAVGDSPSGQLAYIFQLFSMASRKDNDYKKNGGLDLYTRDELLDNLMIYWVNNCFTTSSRIYAETFNERNLHEGLYAVPTCVPTWTAHTKNEIIYQSPLMLKFKFTNLLHSSIFCDYGHFFAFEQPDVFVNDVLAAIDAFIKYNNGRNNTTYLQH